MQMRRTPPLAVALLLAVPALAHADGPPTITGGPAEGAATRDTSARFAITYADPAPEQRLECQLDRGAWKPCTNPALPQGEHVLTGLADGRHELRARRVGGLFSGDPLSDEGPSAPRTWIVDTTGPETTIVRAPARLIRAGRTIKYSFDAGEPDVTFACSWDGAPFAPCRSPMTYKKVRLGAHRFAVSAIDALGNPDVTPATLTFRAR